MHRHAHKEAVRRPGTGTERSDSKPGATRPSTATQSHDRDRAGTPAETEREKRSKRADVGEAAEQGGSGDHPSE